MYQSFSLKSMPYAQARVRVEKGKIVLQSYATDVCIVDEEGWLEVTGLYSMTTRRHIGAFCKDYFPTVDFHICKSIYLANQKINVHTGEVLPL